MTKTTLFLLTIIMIVSCSTLKPKYVITKSHSEVCKEMCSGKQKHEIISVFGPHDRKTEDGLGGEVLIYTQESIISADYSTTSYTIFKNVLSSSTTSKNGVSKKDVKEMAFYIDTLNSCYKLRTEGYDFSEKKYLEPAKPVHYDNTGDNNNDTIPNPPEELKPGIYYNEYNCVIDQEISVTEVKIKCLNETGRAYDKHTVKKSELSFHEIKHEWEITNEALLEVDTYSYENADPGIYYNGNSCEIDEEISPIVVKIKCINETGRAKDKFTIKKSELVFHETNHEWKITEETLNNPKDPPGLYYNGALCTIIKELADGKVKIKYPNESGRANDKKVVSKSDLVEVK